MPRGTITRFDAARGSGSIHLETGDDVHFDVSVATTSSPAELSVGRSVEVVTGIGRGAQLIARIVLVDLHDDDRQPLEAGFTALQAVGLFPEWRLADAHAVAGEGELTRESAGALLLAYYGTKGLSARARADRVAYLDEHFGDSPVIPVDDLASFAPPELREALVAGAKGAHPFTLGSVLAAFNGVLQSREQALHYYLLDAASDRYVAVTLREDALARAANATVLRVVS